MKGLKGFCRRAIGDESGNAIVLTAMCLTYLRGLSETCLKSGHDRSRAVRGPMYVKRLLGPGEVAAYAG